MQERLSWVPARAAVCLVALAAGNASPQTLTDPSLTLSTVTTGLASPTTMAFVAPGDILVLEKGSGRVRRVLNGVLQPGAVVDFAVNSESERGLLGIAVNGESPRKVFVYVTEAATKDDPALANRVYRFDWNAGAGTLTNQVLVLELPVDPGPNHDGGVLLTDGANRLYAVIGDLSDHAGQLQNVAAGPPPDDTSVIFRLDPDGSPAAANPFTPFCSTTTTQTCTSDANCPGGETCRTGVARYYAYGIRNSFGMAIDPVTGTLWDTENGPTEYDEVNRVEAGFNSGWNVIMGPDARDPEGTGDLFDMPGAGSTYSDPEFSWFEQIAPTAILFPRGLTPLYDGVALVGDSNNGNLYRFPLNPARDGFELSSFAGLSDLVADDVNEQDLLRIGSGFRGLTDLEQGPDGAVYVVSLVNGAIYRIAAGGTAFHTLTPCRLLDTRTGTPLTSGVERLFTLAGSCGVPASARALSLNVTVTAPGGPGHLTVFPGDQAVPPSSTLNFSAGQTRANSMVAPLSGDGQGRVKALASVAASGAVHLILDVNGYFQ
jgi:glucose/arabinose dehydrogenase